ncbi:hypothetical protein SCLCIDRAFT_1222500 [Scleroderma citrinum Foug A]|uniref:MARVEL domain-containing protein n=1 Tax=Scleroderma citrinum Foug A TaxID=1036808 RepID=A0A0C3DBK7_9AGAM|nr:hypothetical protein SCLCIDRAFT_1222500 [Scleroderma citrinum Foug A]
MRSARPLPLNCQYHTSTSLPQATARPHQQLRERQTSRRRRLSRISLSTLSVSTVFRRFTMPSRFNVVRASIYVVVLLWTVICLAIAAHFQSLLVINDITRFVPYAIFVCSASMLILLVLLGCSVLRNGNPINTRTELGCLGLLGTFWLALGAFLASSSSENADVECFSSADETTLIDVAGFSTDIYHAQYRVLEAFSLFNVILIWAFLLFLLAMAVKHHLHVNRNVWFISVTSYPWFGSDANASKLPAPVVSRSRSRGRAHAKEDPELWRKGSGSSRRGDLRYPEYKAPARAYTVDKYMRNASPRR